MSSEVSEITNASGQVISETKYKAWGEVRFTSNPSPTNYTYTGQYSYTADFGLMYYNARWYDPALGRFAQADTLVPAGVQGLDRYAYVNNSPMNYVDPSGHEPKYGEGACYEIDCKNANGTEVTYGNGKGGEPKVNAPKTCQTSGVYCDSENNIDVIIEDTYKYGKIFGYFFPGLNASNTTFHLTGNQAKFLQAYLSSGCTNCESAFDFFFQDYLPSAPREAMPVLDEMIDIANSLNYGNTQELAQSIMEVSSGESNTYIDTHISIRENYYFGYNTNKVAIISISSERDYQAYKWIDELPSSSYIKDLISYTIQNHK